MHRLCFLSAFVVLASMAQLALAQTDGGQSEVSLAGPIRVVKLLWNSSPKSAAQSLRSTLEKATARKQWAILERELAPLGPLAEELAGSGNTEDFRYTTSIAVLMLIGQTPDDATLGGAMEAATDSDLPLLLSVLFAKDQESAWKQFAANLSEESPQAKRAEWLTAAFEADRQRATKLTIGNWSNLDAKERLQVTEPMSTSAATMRSLVKAVQDGIISKDLLNTNQLRKWLQADNAELTALILKTWGQIRLDDNAERQRLVAETIRLLNSDVSGSASRGQEVFVRVCSQCHVLHGQGVEVGPNIYGNGRGSLQQLVSNVLDPSLVIGEAFQARTIVTFDGEVVSGLVVSENDRYLTIKAQGGKLREFSKEDDIDLMKISDKSLMPEGVEAQMKQQELIDLFAYLCLLKPLGSEGNELIPGTPEGLVTP